MARKAPVSAEDRAYRENEGLNYSSLRVFNVCPNLYYEQFVTKTYEEPDRDYFLYGSLVDCMLTTPDELDKLFVRVDSKLDALDALKYEQKIKELNAEMSAADKKGETMVEKAERGNKTAQAGLEKREREIEDLRTKLSAIKELGLKQQITNGMWQNALATAEAIKANPLFRELSFDEFTSQQVFVDEKTGRKGKLDYVRFAEPMQQLYAAFKAGLLDPKSFRAGVAQLSPQDRTGVIVDIKTTYLISELEPEIYAGQLAIYRELVEAVTGVRCRCLIVAGDKDPKCKRSQDYELAEPLVDRAWVRYLAVEKAFRACKKDDIWPSAKELWGIGQKCFRCSVCSDRPFSFKGPLVVTGPLFG